LKGIWLASHPGCNPRQHSVLELRVLHKSKRTTSCVSEALLHINVLALFTRSWKLTVKG
jgi:hypothetical protein